MTGVFRTRVRRGASTWPCTALACRHAAAPRRVCPRSRASPAPAPAPSGASSGRAPARTRSSRWRATFLTSSRSSGAQVWPRSGQEVEHGQLFLGQLLANVPLLLVRERATQGEQLLEQVVDVPAARVVGLDQLLELRQVVGAGRVGADQRVELRPHRRPRAAPVRRSCAWSCRSASPAPRSRSRRGRCRPGGSDRSRSRLESGSRRPRSSGRAAR